MTTPGERAAAAVEAMRLVHSADLSPDGRQVAWSESHIAGDEELIELRVEPAGGGTPVPVEHSAQDRSPVWAPDGSAVAFLSTHDGSTAISLFDPATGTCRVLVKGATSGLVIGGSLAWSPDASTIAFAAAAPRHQAGKPYRVTRVVGWVDGLGLVDDSAADIHLVDVPSGRLQRLTDDDWVNRSPCWHGDELRYVASWGPDTWESVATIRSVTRSGVVSDVLVGSDFLAIASLSEVMVASTLGPQPDRLGTLLVVGPAVEVEDRSTELDLDVNGDVIGDVAIPFMDPEARLLLSGSHALVRVQVGGRLEVHRVSLTGPAAHEIVLSGPGCHYPLAVSGDRLLHACGSLTTAPDLFVRDLTSGRDRQISHTAEHNRTALVETVVDQFEARAIDGPPVDCLFLRPAEATGPLPAVLLIHGGPKAAFGQAFFSDAQALCEAGFGVLMVNPRGSRGYGVEFSDAITGDWGNRDQHDLLAAVDAAVASGLADPDRLGVAGLSYGGFMSSWLVGHTDRFRAAVIENPAINFWSMYGTSDVGMRFLPETIGGTPATNFDAYVRMSPVTHAANSRTPSLIVLGEADHRCPPEQGRQFYSALRRAGCEAELLMLPGESHAGSVSGAVLSRRAQNEALVEWMVRHVR